jgi:hypothetical protein
MFLKIKIKIVGMSKARTFRLCIIALLLTHLTSYLSLAEQKDFDSYCNGRFGFCVDYPKHFTIGPEPVNRDGRRFFNSKGFLMVAAGANNALDYTLEQEMGFESRVFFSKIIKRKKGTNWFELWGYKDGDSVFVKTYVGQAATNQLYIKHPRHLDEEYKITIPKIIDSFKPGRLNFPN